MSKLTAFHIGEYLEEELEARGWTTAECARRMGREGREQAIDQLVLDMTIAASQAPEGHAARRATLDQVTADLLERALGIDAGTLMRVDAEFQRREFGETSP